MRLGDLWQWRGNLGRTDFAKWGLLLFAFKYNLDRLVALILARPFWYPWSYFLGPGGVERNTGPGDEAFYLTLLVLSLPFVFWGVILTLRRLRDAGWPTPFVAFFFVPFLNLLFFSFLCVVPSQSAPAETNAWWRRAFATEKKWAAAALAVGASTLLGLALLAFGTTILRSYGAGLFVGIPFMLGFFGALFYSIASVRTWGECASVGMAAIFLTASFLVVLAFEGIICIAMATPIAIVLALLGATAGWWVQLDWWSRHLGTVKLYAMAWVVAPLLLAGEARLSTTPETVAATTTCVVAAAPATVWRHVIAFSELPPPRERLFLLGIAYPVRARLYGTGVGAVRHCEFSTGPFVEPITVWEENRHLAFDVAQQPHPMREWSPYSNLSPAHLEGFFRSRRGEFRLTPLPGGQTLLEGTTWYEQDIWPAAYWRPWSDYLIHSIHQRVLQHIKAEAERGATR